MTREQKYKRLITVLSVLIPLVVAALFGIKVDWDLPVFLPPIYAGINAVTALVLVIAVVSIKKGNRALHEALMKFALLCSVVFLLLYVLHHMTSDSTPYGGEGAMRYVYFFVLISHILLSIAVIPFVLTTLSKALLNDFEGHKKWARITFPLWLYVALSGVLVYFMISPYYAI